MTLIAFATYGSRAELLTDTASYTDDKEVIRQTTKHLTLNHLDAAVLTTGDGRFTDHVGNVMLQAGSLVATFDELVDGSAEWILDFWQEHCENRGLDADDVSSVCLVGYSERHELFRGYVMAREADFEPREVRGVWMSVTPWSHRPDAPELERLTEYAHKFESTHPGGPQAMAEWAAKPTVDKPASVDDWVHLGRMVREQRSFDTYGRILVAGRLIHTRLERGAVTSRVVHRFDDDPEGEEF